MCVAGVGVPRPPVHSVIDLLRGFIELSMYVVVFTAKVYYNKRRHDYMSKGRRYRQSLEKQSLFSALLPVTGPPRMQEVP